VFTLSRVYLDVKVSPACGFRPGNRDDSRAADAIPRPGRCSPPWTALPIRQQCHHFTAAGADAPRSRPLIRDYGVVTEHTERPWGGYTVLAEARDFKVKTIEVLPGQRLSYQRHSRRAEHWFVVRGEGVVTLDGQEIGVRRGDTVDVALGAAHRIRNTGTEPLMFVEVQHGDYFGEDDIVRLDDDYGRVGA
jgi:mannose-6-phosphate isomerase-like protein (cupin superfamily)